MTLRLRNTLTRRVEAIEPLSDGPIRMYTCGPTVYRYVHVGNLRSFLLADLVRRALLYHGLEVFHVKNVTDVGHLRDERFDRGEDRMLVAAGLEHKTSAEIAAAYEAAFHADEALVNILSAHLFPRATEHIPEMLDLAERLVSAGYGYAVHDGTVYYEVSRFPGYGQLSGNSLEALHAGHRSEVDNHKRDPADFALWRAAGEGRDLKWPSPWGDGFPGWHLECSAMALRYLGPEFEIHSGGVDNVFPHHEDEIAQSAAVTGRIPARHWLHGEFLLAEGLKMAKSAGNFVRITDLVDGGADPLSFRYLAFTARYGHKLNLSSESLAAAGAALVSLRGRLRALGPPPDAGSWAPPPVLVTTGAGDRPEGVATGIGGHGGDAAGFPLTDRAHAPRAPLSRPGTALHDRFAAAIDDDLDLPTALAVVREILRADIDPDEKRWLVLDADLVLGLDLDRVWAEVAQTDADDLSAQEAALVARRAEARAARDFATADGIRDELADMGLDLTDAPSGETTWRRVART